MTISIYKSTFLLLQLQRHLGGFFKNPLVVVYSAIAFFIKDCLHVMPPSVLATSYLRRQHD